MSVTSVWEGHLLEPAFWSCVMWALGSDKMLAAYRADTGDEWRPGASGLEKLIDTAAGADSAFLQRFADWVADNVFGRPENLDEADYDRG